MTLSHPHDSESSTVPLSHPQCLWVIHIGVWVTRGAMERTLSLSCHRHKFSTIVLMSPETNRNKNPKPSPGCDGTRITTSGDQIMGKSAGEFSAETNVSNLPSSVQENISKILLADCRPDNRPNPYHQFFNGEAPANPEFCGAQKTSADKTGGKSEQDEFWIIDDIKALFGIN